MLTWTQVAPAYALPAAKGKAVNRVRLLQVVSLMLYAGPLFAGLAGFGWEMVWPFTGIFLLWQIIMRPSDWPREARRWAEPRMLAAGVARIAILAVIVALSFAVGSGLGGTMGFLPSIPALAPLALSLAAIPLARLVWNPADAAEMDAFLDTAIRDIDALSADPSPDAQHLAAATAQADHMLEPLSLMPDATPDETILAHLHAMARHVDDARLREALLGRCAAGPETPMVLQRALMLHASDGRLMETLGGDNAVRAFLALPDTPAVFETFARRLAAALQQNPGAWWAMPSSETMAQRADRLRGTPAEGALRDLIVLNNRLAPPENAVAR
jgi:hypothetical protein